jgi:two-component system phosphate regulon response regulator PhoB
MRPQLLITEDERDLLDTLYYNFKKENYDVYTASSGKEAIEILNRQSIDLAILDIMLPDMSGLDVCKHIKINRSESHTAVIILTAKGEEIDRILGFELGADDYVVKPFSIRELTLRVSSLFKRNENLNKNNNIIFGDISINLDSHIVKISDRVIKLTIKEFNLLHILIKNKEKVMTRERLLNKVWNYNQDITTRTVDTHIRRVREKIRASCVSIETIRSLGYMITNKKK